MTDCVLVLNAGSSSLKFAMFDITFAPKEPISILRGQISGIGGKSAFKIHADLTSGSPESISIADTSFTDHHSALHGLLEWIDQHTTELTWTGIGHRVVHGGRRRTSPELVTAELMTELDALAPLAPHHQPHNLAAIRELEKQLPGVPQVACFDTAFHAGQSELIRRLPLPARYAERGVMRYGFHGLSYEYITGAVPDHNNGVLPQRLLIAHLGNGASLCAVRDAQSAATTMGFSTLDGLMMGTRSGSIDPGVMLYLMREDGMSETELTDLFYNQCGLLGVSGISADMRTLLESDDPHARQAVALYCHIVVASIGSMVAVLEGLDGLVFTGGVGEHAAQIRMRVCERLTWLGVNLDPVANAENQLCISKPSSTTPVWVIPANEELVIARHTARLISKGGI